MSISLIFAPPAYLVQPRGVIEAAQRRLAPVGEQEPLTGDELPHHVRNEDFAPLGPRSNARRRDNSRPKQVLLFGDGLPRVEADAYL